MPPVRRNASVPDTPPPEEAERITLGDLSVEDRRVLLEQAREEAKHNPTEVEGYEDLTVRERAIRRAMDARDHVRNCPVQTGTSLGRIEGYDATKPPNPSRGEPARDVAIIRCMECGGQSTLDEPLEAALAPFTRELEASV